MFFWILLWSGIELTKGKKSNIEDPPGGRKVTYCGIWAGTPLLCPPGQRKIQATDCWRCWWATDLALMCPWTCPGGGRCRLCHRTPEQTRAEVKPTEASAPERRHDSGGLTWMIFQNAAKTSQGNLIWSFLRKHMSHCSIQLYLLHNGLFSFKVINCKKSQTPPHKRLCYWDALETDPENCLRWKTNQRLHLLQHCAFPPYHRYSMNIFTLWINLSRRSINQNFSCPL